MNTTAALIVLTSSIYSMIVNRPEHEPGQAQGIAVIEKLRAQLFDDGDLTPELEVCLRRVMLAAGGCEPPTAESIAMIARISPAPPDAVIPTAEIVEAVKDAAPDGHRPDAGPWAPLIPPQPAPPEPEPVNPPPAIGTAEADALLKKQEAARAESERQRLADAEAAELAGKTAGAKDNGSGEAGAIGELPPVTEVGTAQTVVDGSFPKASAKTKP